MTVQAAFAATLVDEWARCGLREAVVSPGSRSTPLVLELARHPAFRMHVRLDERSAAFFALGLGIATGQPAVLVTTSGTAAVEVHAAVVEAHHGRVPLLVATADRPPELRDVGASQAIDQRGIYGSSLRWSVDPGPAANEARHTWRALAVRLVSAAGRHPAGPGPVHLNLPFREPLVGEAGELPAGRPAGAPWLEVRPRRAGSAPDDEELEVMSGLLSEAPRGLIVAGEGCDGLGDVDELAARLGWPVVADPRASPRIPSPQLVAAADAILRCEEASSALAPDLVLRLGAPPTSKVVAAWLAGCGDAPQLLVDPRWPWIDPDAVADQVVLAPPGAVVRRLLERLTKTQTSAAWLEAWQAAEEAAQRAIDESLSEQPGVTEPGLARTVYASLPPGSTLFASSSMPVRDLEWFGRPRQDPPLVLANRGASGIDGVVSTALGVAAGAPDRPVTALVGDLAFLHDLSALVWGDDDPPPATIVVVDNGGGGIFSFLPQAAALPREAFQRLFLTPQRPSPAGVAGAAGCDTFTPGSLAELSDLLAHEPARLRVVVVETDGAANVACHDAVWSRVRDGVSVALRR